MITPVNAVSGRQILGVAVALQVEPREAQFECWINRQVDRALNTNRVEIAILRGDKALELVAGLAGDQVDRSARRVAAIKRALRPAQHLDPLNVEKFVLGTHADGREVEQDAGAIVGGRRNRVVADAANGWPIIADDQKIGHQ